MNRYLSFAFSFLLVSQHTLPACAQTVREIHPLHTVPLGDVTVHDPFWSAKLNQWATVTLVDILDKFEGRYTPDREDLINEQKDRGRTRDAFRNFDRVAQGKSNIGISDGPPWYDGLVYETIRGAADLLVAHPEPAIEKRIDGYIARIAAAQAADPDGYINTYTTLNAAHQRWGLNGGNDRWQHDVYNAGMLMEAGVHYYRATKKTTLLEVAVRMTNYMCNVMGPAPKLNVIPAHAGPEEALLKLYELFQEQPSLKKQLGVSVKENNYLALVNYWIETRGTYADADGGRKRTSDGSYNQDHLPIFQQTTIEGHAVRATLLGTGIAATALHNHDQQYIRTANNYWNNMIGRRTFITGGQGAIANDEKFGADYHLPESAYLETCAAIGACFFSQRMNQLMADGQYVDELERVLYNNILAGIALDGQHYHYENPLVAQRHTRWGWHSCPCCPPMFLKMMGSLPGYIYAHDNANLYINLFIGSEARVSLNGKQINVRQQTSYPWQGLSSITVSPASPSAFSVYVRIPGWAVDKENPFDLYTSNVPGEVTVKVNGQPVAVRRVHGYAEIKRTWKKGDIIELSLPVSPRLIIPSPDVEDLQGKVALAAGPIVYALEGTDNGSVDSLRVPPHPDFSLAYDRDILGGVNILSGNVLRQGVPTAIRAIPFYTIGNRGSAPHTVWLKTDTREAIPPNR